MKNALCFLAAIAAVTAFAGQKAPTTVKCAIETENSVNIKQATKAHMYADYKGNRYFFCCDGCPQTFKANPAKYAKRPHIKLPAKTK